MCLSVILHAVSRHLTIIKNKTFLPNPTRRDMDNLLFLLWKTMPRGKKYEAEKCIISPGRQLIKIFNNYTDFSIF